MAHGIRKVGIYKDTREENVVHLVVRTDESTLYFVFDGNDFVDGWFDYDVSRDAKTVRGSRKSPYLKRIGSIRRIQSRLPTPMHPLMQEALLQYGITPTSLAHLDRSGPRRVKWVDRNKGGWGGRRRTPEGKRTEGQGQ